MTTSFQPKRIAAFKRLIDSVRSLRFFWFAGLPDEDPWFNSDTDRALIGQFAAEALDQALAEQLPAGEYLLRAGGPVVPWARVIIPPGSAWIDALASAAPLQLLTPDHTRRIDLARAETGWSLWLKTRDPLPDDPDDEEDDEPGEDG